MKQFLYVRSFSDLVNNSSPQKYPRSQSSKSTIQQLHPLYRATETRHLVPKGFPSPNTQTITPTDARCWTQRFQRRSQTDLRRAYVETREDECLCDHMRKNNRMKGNLAIIETAKRLSERYVDGDKIKKVSTNLFLRHRRFASTQVFHKI